MTVSFATLLLATLFSICYLSSPPIFCPSRFKAPPTAPLRPSSSPTSHISLLRPQRTPCSPACWRFSTTNLCRTLPLFSVLSATRNSTRSIGNSAPTMLIVSIEVTVFAFFIITMMKEVVKCFPYLHPFLESLWDSLFISHLLVWRFIISATCLFLIKHTIFSAYRSTRIAPYFSPSNVSTTANMLFDKSTFFPSIHFIFDLTYF